MIVMTSITVVTIVTVTVAKALPGIWRRRENEGLTNNNDMDVTARINDYREIDDKRYVVLSRGSLLREEWLSFLVFRW